MKIGITAGTFDVLHAGHVLMFEEAKTQCEHLIVLLQTDPTIDRANKNKPVQSITERFIQLKACKFVDEIIPYDTEESLLNLLNILKYDVRIIGSDWKNKEFTGYDIPGHIEKCYFNKRSHNYSSTYLRDRIKHPPEYK